MTNKRRTHPLLIFAAAMIALAACGSSAGSESAAEPSPTADQIPSSPPGAAAPPSATRGGSDIGDVLVGDRDLTLYGFTNDIDATSTCYGTCAEAWPPVIVDRDWTVAPDLDSGIFATTVGDDGQLQLVAGKWPLDYFAGDAVAGDVNGQGSGDVWFTTATDGTLITDAAGAAPLESAAPAGTPETTAQSELGQILVDGDGLTLYGFANDADGTPTCNADCADAWPPAVVESDSLPDGLDPSVFSVVQRDDGAYQIKAGAWPLYRFAADTAPGDVKGQGSGDVWFAVTPDGSLITSADEGGASDEGY